jgi:ceramide glucosyltransferase
MLEGVKFAVGPTLAARRSMLEAIGGFDVLKDYLAEDFVMGKFAAEAGFGVILSRTIVEHRIGSETGRANASHRIRWARSTRRSRPLGYIGQLFTYPLPIALLACAIFPAWWPALLVIAVLRAAAAWSTAVWVLKTRPNWLLLPIQDILSFLFWLAGFFGNTVTWRGRRYYLFRDGRFELR